MEEKFISHIQNHEGIIHKVIRLYVDGEEERKDLYQEILLQTWKSFKNFRKESKFSTWLYKVCLNTTLTYRKKEENRQVLTGPMPESAKHHAEHDAEEHELLYLIIKRLKEVDKMLISLHLDGYKNKEIAGITGLTVNHVNVKVHRIKANIIDQFKKESDGHI